MFSNVCSGGVGLRFIRGLFKFIVNAVLLLLVVYTVLNAIGGIETDVEPVVDVTQLRASLVPLSYDDLARYPDENKGKSVVYRGKVVQKVSDTTFRVNITQDKYGFWSDTVYVELKGQAKEARILEDDIIELLGVTNGERSYRAVLGNRITIPRISVYEARVLAKAGEPWPPPKQVTADEARDIVVASSAYKASLERYTEWWNQTHKTLFSIEFSVAEFTHPDGVPRWSVTAHNPIADPEVRTAATICTYIVDKASGQIYHYNNSEGFLVPVD